MRGELAAAGLSVREEEFPLRSTAGGRGVLAAVALSGLAAAWLLSGSRPLVSSLICLGLLAGSLLAARLWLAIAAWLPPKGPGRSRNLIAARPGASPSLYLCAHHDTKSQALPLVPRLAVGLGLSALLAALAFLLAWGSGLPLWPLFTVSALCVGVLGWQPEGNRSPGALDNGAAVALLLALAGELPPTVGLVFFGAEELGLLGSLDFARRHPEVFCTAQFLNLDGLGLAGRLRLFGGQGELGERVRRAAKASGVPLRPSFLWPGLLMDHVALSRAGLEAVSLGCAGAKLARVHSAADTPELVETEGLREAAALLLVASRHGLMPAR
jgi:hypothetical protein